MALSVLTPDEKLAALKWPALQTIQRISLAPEDCIVVCAGFEDRALGILESAVRAGAPFNVILVIYRPFLTQNKEGEMRRMCRSVGIDPVELIYDREDLV